MCDHHPSPASPTPAPTRHGSKLEHGTAHTHDHARWSRRSFLTSMGLATAGSMMVGHTPVRAYAGSPLLRALQRLETDRVLVLVQMRGGNDGLNTVVPITNDVYYQQRPTVAIQPAQTLRLTDELGMNQSFAPFEAHYGEGRMAVVQNVGYPDPNLSHFRSTDIWESASDADKEINTGWAGRYLEEAFLDPELDPPTHPLAVQLGRGASQLFQGATGNLGMSLISAALYRRIAETGQLYQTTDIPETTYGQEMSFVRRVLNDSFTFANAIGQVFETNLNRVEYPAESNLGEQLSIVAQMIKGNLGARIYSVTLGGFDTHSNQRPRHNPLLRELADSVAAFMDDLEADGLREKVLVMTYSEFGRRIHENGSTGTDHGSSAPLFLLGGEVVGGIYGKNPDLVDLDHTGNIAYEFDFRSVYATVMQDWFDMPAEDVELVLGRSFDRLGFLSGGANPTAVETEAVPGAFALHQNYPNPFNPATTISYALARAGHVQLRVYDVRGRLVRTLVDAAQPAGRYTQSFDAAGLPSGTYLYRLETPDGHQSRRMTLVR